MKIYTWRWLLCRYLRAICCDCTTRISNWGGSFDSSAGYIKCNISRSLEDLVISIYLSFSNLFLHLFRFLFHCIFNFATLLFYYFFVIHIFRLSIASVYVSIYDILACLILCAILTTKPVFLPL